MRLGAAKDDFYEVRQRSDKRGVHLISDELPFGRLQAVLCSALKTQTGLDLLGVHNVALATAGCQ